MTDQYNTIDLKNQGLAYSDYINQEKIKSLVIWNLYYGVKFPQMGKPVMHQQKIAEMYGVAQTNISRRIRRLRKEVKKHEQD